LLDYVCDGRYKTCGNVAGVARQQGYLYPWLLRFQTIYTGRQSWDDLRADLNNAAEKQGFQLTVSKSKHAAQATVWKLSCTHHIMFEEKSCKCNYVNNEAQYDSGMKVTTVKENCRVEQHGPTGISQPRKTETSLPTLKNDACPFKINICFKKEDGLFYLSKKGSVHTHIIHVRRTFIFARANQLDKNMEKMIKDFEVANVKPSTASRFLHQMDDRVYDHKAISNVVVKAKKMWLSERGIDT
jgi:hypothetical protein